jgi:hypothetical protein
MTTKIKIKSITFQFADEQTNVTIVSQPYLELANGDLIEDPKGVHSVTLPLSAETLAANQVHISHDEQCALCDLLTFDQDVITAAVKEYSEAAALRDELNTD